jgi:transposase
MGRRTGLTPDVQARIIEALTSGNYVETAAAYAGVTKQSFYTWKARGELERSRVVAGEEPNAAETIFADFLDAVEKAQATAQVRNVALIQRAATDTWQAAAWWLERTRPKDWGRKVQTEVSGPDGGAVQVTAASPADLEDKVRMILASRGVQDAASDDNAVSPERDGDDAQG